MTGDEKVKNSIVRANEWLVNVMYQPDKKTFRYFECTEKWDSNMNTLGYYALNPMYFEMLGYASYISGNDKYLKVGREIAEDSINKTKNYAGHLKEFNEAYRNSGRGLYWLVKKRN